jgi:hypothetical protein
MLEAEAGRCGALWAREGGAGEGTPAGLRTCAGLCGFPEPMTTFEREQPGPPTEW